jgi:hypothetical protein
MVLVQGLEPERTPVKLLGAFQIRHVEGGFQDMREEGSGHDPVQPLGMGAATPVQTSMCVSFR